MRKNNTNQLMTLNFWRMCGSNLLLFASIYMLFPLLPFAMEQRLAIPPAHTSLMYLIFALAMILVGPFHAYLGDAYKRKNVLIYSMFIMLAATLGYTFATNYAELLLLALVQGGCFGLATTAGITVAIDITTSTRRSEGNLVYAWAGRLGMLAGAVVGVWLYQKYGFRTMTYVSVAIGVLGLFLISQAYVAFRAPIGVSMCNVDRFWLPRAWAPFLNMVLVAFVPGILLPLMMVGNYWALLALAFLAIITIPLTKMFVKLSQHCQRGTANTTCHLSMEIGVLMGLAAACYLMDEATIYHIGSTAAILSVLLFVLLTHPYYKKKRVRK